VRQAKQFLKARVEGFDERKYGFASVVDLLRAAAKEGVLKLERDRHGAFRVFAGAKLTAPPPRVEVEEPMVDAAGELIDELPTTEGEPIEEPPIVDVQPIETTEGIPVAVAEAEPVFADVVAETIDEPPTKSVRKRKTATRGRAAKATARKTEKVSRVRGRKSARAKSEAADR